MKVDEFANKSLKEITEAIKEQIAAAGIQHVVIDNLQQLICLTTLYNDQMSAFEKINLQVTFTDYI